MLRERGQVEDHTAAVFLGGDLLPRSAFSAIQFGHEDFVHDYPMSQGTTEKQAIFDWQTEADLRSTSATQHEIAKKS
ncbi:MAG: hypothetical protein ACM34E_00075, partial [Acidobacteriota bacterium]